MESMDELVSRLQSMFPSIEGDVIGVVLNESDRNLESAIEKLLWLSNEEDTSSSTSCPSRGEADFQTRPPKSQETVPISAITDRSWSRNQPPSKYRRGSEPTTNQKQQMYTAKPSTAPHSGYIYPSSYYRQPTSYQTDYSGYYYPGATETATQPLYGGLLYAPWLNPQATAVRPHASDKQVPVSSGQGVSGGQTTPVEWPSSFHLEGGAEMLPSSSHEMNLVGEVKETVGGPKRLIMLRGLPGSGKSTLARELVGTTGIICSTDDFFIVDGRYLFDPSKLGENHDKNKQRVREAFVRGISPVVIDNTNVAAWEMKPYVIMAHEFGYEVEIREPDTPWKFKVEDLERRNGHGVPRQHLERMLERYEHNVTIESILASSQPERRDPRRRSEGYQSPPSTSRGFSSNARTRQFSGNRSPGQMRRDQPPRFSKGPTSPGDPRKLHSPRESSSVGTVGDSRKHDSSRGAYSPGYSRKPPSSRGPSSPGDSRKAQSLRGPPFHGNIGDSRRPQSSRGSPFHGNVGDSRRPQSSRGSPFHGNVGDSRRPQSSRGPPFHGNIGDSRRPHFSQPYRSTRHYGSSEQESAITSEENSLQNLLQQDRGFIDLTIAEPDETSLHEVQSCPQFLGLQNSNPPNGETPNNWDQYRIHRFSEIMLQDSMAQDRMPRESMPQERMAQNRMPRESIPQERMAQDRMPQESMPQELMAQEDLLQNKMPKESMPQDNMPQESMPQDNMPKGSMPQNNMPQESKPQDNMPQESKPQNNMPQDSMPHEGDSVIDWAAILQPSADNQQSDLSNLQEPPPVHFHIGQQEASAIACKMSNPEAETMFLQCTTETTKSTPRDISSQEKHSDSSFDDPAIVQKGTRVSEYPTTDSWPESDSFEAPSLPTSTLGQIPEQTPPPDVSSDGVRLQEAHPLDQLYTVDEDSGVVQAHLLDQIYSVPPVNDDSGIELSDANSVRTSSEAHPIPCTETSTDSYFPSAYPVPAESSNESSPIAAPQPNTTFTIHATASNHSEDKPELKVEPETEEEISNASNISYTSNISSSSSVGYPGLKSDMYIGTGYRGSETYSDCEPESDLNFLIDCFPGLDSNYLKLLYQRSNENVEEAVSHALLSSMVSSPQRDLTNFHFPLAADSLWVSDLDETSSTISSVSYTSDYVTQSCMAAEEGNAVDTTSVEDTTLVEYSQTDDQELVPFGTLLEEEGIGEDINSDMNECINDEEIARLLQEQLNHEAAEDQIKPSPVPIAPPLNEEQQPPESEAQLEDGNLLLKLTPSLATQLENMFGTVKDYLPLKGEMQDEDLVVLLSERAAKAIYQKWIDTLVAKGIEYQMQSDRQVNADAALALELQEAEKKKSHADNFGWQDRRKKQRHNTAPVLPSNGSRREEPPSSRGHTVPPYETSQHSLCEIMDEQLAENIRGQEEANVVKAVCHNNMAQKVQLQNLYSRFPQLDKIVINRILVKNRFNFKSTVIELEKQLNGDTTDGNATSAAKPVTSNTSNHKAGTGKPTTNTDRTVSKAKPATTSRKHKPTLPTKSRKSKPKAVKFENEGARPLYDDLRAEAALHAKMRAESFQKAAYARSKKQGQVAWYYAQQGHMHTEKMNEANERAADLILRRQNDPQSTDTLDLHGLHVNEALKALEEKLATLKKGCFVYVITGRGIHSKGKEARLKPAVLQYLQQNGYSFVEPNPGMLKVETRTST